MPGVHTVIPHNFVSEIFTPDSARPHAIATTGSGRSFHYDGNGNMDSDGKRSIAYNSENMPASATYGSTVVNYTYDGNSQRVKKTSGDFTRLYIGKLYECRSDGLCGKYIFAGDTLIAVKDSQSLRYHHGDHLGSTKAVTDSAGNKIESIDYYPFGETRADTGSITVNHKYTSQELDYEIGLYNYNARLYDPELGRFVSADSIVPNPANPQSFNRYSYVLNNPLLYTDPTGHSWHRKHWRNFFKSVATGVVAGAVFVATGGTGAPASAAIMSGMYAGAAAGATGAALNGGGAKEILTGAVLGGALGAAGGSVYAAGGAIGGTLGSATAGHAVASGAMLAGGAGYSYHQGGWTGVANFAGGIAGGIAGGAGASFVNDNWFGSSADASNGSANKTYIDVDVDNVDMSNQYAELDIKKWAQMTDSVEYHSTQYNNRLNTLLNFAGAKIQGFALGVPPPSPVTALGVFGMVLKNMVFPQELSDPYLSVDGTWRYPAGEQVPGKGRLW